jgi:hypothetical protein
MAYINQKYVPEDKTTEKEKQATNWKALLLGLRKAPIDQSSYRRRSQIINQGGVDATNYESRKKMAEQAAWMERQQRNMNNETARQIRVSTGPSSYNPGGGRQQQQSPGYTPGPTGNKSFDAFMSAISSKESDGNYNARNRSSGAMGKYQIMPGNLGGKKSGWDYEALGRDVTPGQFMGSPQIQEAIARYKLQQYYKKYGARGAAIAWYAGPGALKYSSGSLNRKQGNYPSIGSYANDILKRLGL